MNAADAAKQVAKDHLGLDSLVMQNRDSLDFKSFNVAEIKFALVAAFKLGQQNPKVEPKWYCFDKHDTFGGYDTALEAAAQLEYLVADGLTGVHMAQMTEAEFKQYCTDGKFPFNK
jgi:hypothetical protein